MDPVESAVFHADVQSDETLHAELEAARRMWSLVADSQVDETWDVNSAWKNILVAQHKRTGRVRRIRLVRLGLGAAAVLFLLTGIWAFFQMLSTRVYSAGDKATLVVQLSDGTQVTLRQGATLKASAFTSRRRKVFLTGEAYFQVVHDPGRPFLVYCGETLTEVMGTSFTLREVSDSVAILVESGKVVFRDAGAERKAIVALQAGEAALYRSNTMTLMPAPSPNFSAWRTRELRFTGIPLEVAVRDISLFFGKTITIESDTVKSCRITIPISFREPDLRAVLRAVAVAVQADLVDLQGRYVLRGGRCR